MGTTFKISILLLFLYSTALFSRSQSIIVYDVPFSTKISIVELQELDFGRLFVATSGTIAVNNLGLVFVSGDVVSEDQNDVIPSICEVIFTPAVWEPDSVVGVTKTVTITVSTNEEMVGYNGSPAVNFDFEDITKGRENSVRDGKDIITLTIGGILYVTQSTQSDYYSGLLTVSVDEL